MGHILSSGRVQIATVCCAISFAVLGWTAIGAIRPSRSRSQLTRVVPATGSTGIERAGTTSDTLIENALDHDPFSPARKRPMLRYGALAQTVAARTAPAPDVLHLVGTVVDSGGGSFVLCQLGSGSARVVRVGQTLGTYQLRSISQGTAIFVTGDGQRLELRVPKTGS